MTYPFIYHPSLIRAAGAAALAFCVAWLSGCEEQTPTGSIEVLAAGSGTFEVYKVGKDVPFQLESEYVGEFNKPLDLKPGQYLILSDCSSEQVVVLPHIKKTLVSHRVRFRTPTIPTGKDKFTILCSRHDRSKSNQKLSNKFELNLLSGQREMLVGMNPLRLNLPPEQKTPLDQEFLLSAFKVAAADDLDTNFFVSPLEGQIAITEYQHFGSNLFLLPGRYRVQVNGSYMNIELKDGEIKQVAPSFLRIEAPAPVDFALATKIAGEPLYVDLNGGHRLAYNQTYPVLPSEVKIRLSGSNGISSVYIASGEEKVIKVGGLKVDFGCGTYEWSCIGKKKVYLYRPGEEFPFLVGDTDSPMLFTEKDILVEVEGARNIRKELTIEEGLKTVGVGFLRLDPIPVAKKRIYTDLLRVEAQEEGLIGHSIDISLKTDTVLPLLVGSYDIAQYVSYVDDDVGERIDTKKRIKVRRNQEINFPITVFLKESRYSQFLKQLSQSRRRRLRAVYPSFPELAPKVN